MNSGIIPKRIRSSGSSSRISSSGRRTESRRRAALENLEQGLLHALTGDITRDRNVLGLAADLVDFVDVDDPALGALHIVVGGLQQTEDHILHVLTDIARLGQGRGIGNRERHVEDPGQRTGQQRLPRAGRTDEEDVAFLDLHTVELGRQRRRILHGLAGIEHQPLVVIVDGDRENLLGVLLTDHVLIEGPLDLRRLHQTQIRLCLTCGLAHLTIDDRLADVDARVADVNARPGNDLLHLRLRLAAEGAERHAGRLGHGKKSEKIVGDVSRANTLSHRHVGRSTEAGSRWLTYDPSRGIHPGDLGEATPGTDHSSRDVKRPGRRLA
jgi:hypothetical protein